MPKSTPFVPKPGQPAGQVLVQAFTHAVKEQGANPLTPPVVKAAMQQLQRDLRREAR